MLRIEVEERVEAGMAFLDNHFQGTDWRNRIDLQSLAIEGDTDCICGQLFHSYNRALELLHLDPGRACLLGFVYPPLGAPREVLDRENQALTEVWREKLTQWRNGTITLLHLPEDAPIETQAEELVSA